MIFGSRSQVFEWGTYQERLTTMRYSRSDGKCFSIVEIVLLVRSCNVILNFGTKCNVITVYIYLVSQLLKLNLKRHWKDLTRLGLLGV